MGLLCTPGAPINEFVEIWPALPIIMDYGGTDPIFDGEKRNLVAALRHSDRIQKIELTTRTTLGDRLALEMRKNMPFLESLLLTQTGVVLPDDFLGGAAPALRQVILDGVTFSALPKFLLSTINLVTLELWHYPPSEYFSPAALAVGLSASTQLKTLIMHFRMLSVDASTFPLERTVLPALTNLTYHGFIEYFDNFVARIDTPLIELIHLRFHNEDVVNFPHLHDFICRTRQMGSPTHAKVESCTFYSDASIVLLHGPVTTHNPTSPGQLRLNVSMAYPMPWRHLSVISQLSCQLLPLLSEVQHLNIIWLKGSHHDPDKWVEILRRFSRIERLEVNSGQASNIAQVLRQAALEPDPGFLPALRKLHHFGGYRDVLEPFIKARQLSGNPVDA